SVSSLPRSPSVPNSRCNASKSVSSVWYFNRRATFVCLALARPRPIGSTPSHKTGAASNPDALVSLRMTSARTYNGTGAGAVPPHPGGQRVRESSSMQVNVPQAGYVGDPPLGEPVGGDGRWDAVAGGQSEDLAGRVEDACRLVLGAFE